ncbi:hypothetical protein ES703_53256 [subsurface metagenome]
MTEQRIIESTQELERAQEAAYALTTYANYVTAWVVFLNRQYGIGNEGRNAFLAAMAENDNVRRLQGGITVSDELTAAYCRGQLTFRAMQALPVEEHPHLARSANFWLPVQSYYAIHGTGLAAMIALNMAPPQSHMTFRAAFSAFVHTYFPAPFCGLCLGGPDRKDFIFRSLSTDISRVTRQTHLTSPEHIEDLETFVGKSLSTTRQEFLAKRFEKKRNKEKKRRLTRQVKNQCCQNEHSTSICDLLYRLRLRSNYDNPDMYLFAPTDQETAFNSYKELLRLTELLIAGLDVLIEKRIGRKKAVELRKWLD